MDILKKYPNPLTMHEMNMTLTVLDTWAVYIVALSLCVSLQVYI